MHLRAGAAVATALFALAASCSGGDGGSRAAECLSRSRRRPRTRSSSRKAGFDMHEADHGSYLEIYGTAKQADRLRSQGLAPQVVGAERAAGPQTTDAAGRQ